jgi:hypothetical protein
MVLIVALLVVIGVIWAAVAWRTSGRPVKLVLPLAFTSFCLAEPFVRRWWRRREAS